MRGLTVVCTVRSGEVVEPFSFVEFSLEIDMPMELGLELVTTICTHFANAEWEFFNDVVNEVDHCPAGYAQHVREGAFACVCFS